MSNLVNSIYNSGPGWVHDILSLSVHLDADYECVTNVEQLTAINPDLPAPISSTTGGETVVLDVESQQSQGAGENTESDYHSIYLESCRRWKTSKIPVVPMGRPISGFIRVAAPPGRNVHHNGIKAAVDATLYAIDSIPTKDLYCEEITITGPGTIFGCVDIPFVFSGSAAKPLEKGPNDSEPSADGILELYNAMMPPTYEGDLFSIRHSITVSIQRPWYTFDVNATSAFSIQPLTCNMKTHPRFVVTPYDSPRLSDDANTENKFNQRLPGVIQRLPAMEQQGGESSPLSTLRSYNSKLGASLTDPRGNYGKFDPFLLPLSPLLFRKQKPFSPVSVEFALKDAVSPNESTETLSQIASAGAVAPTYGTSQPSQYLHLESNSYSLTETIKGSVEIRNIPSNNPILLLVLSLMKIETADSESLGSVIFEGPLVDARNWRRRKDERLELQGTTVVSTTGGGKIDNEAEADSISNSSKRVTLAHVDNETNVNYQEELDKELGKGQTSRWIPDSSDYNTDNADPDLPIIGDVSLGITLDLSALKLQPSIAVDLSGKITSATMNKLSDAGSDDEISNNVVSVRYFLNVLAYSGTEKALCSAAKAEIVIYSNEPRGEPIPEHRVPKPIGSYKGFLNVDTPFVQSLSDFLGSEGDAAE